MLVFPLKKIFYDRIASGDKSIEYRVAKEYWLRRTINAFFENADRDSELFQSMENLWDLGGWSEAEDLFIFECSKGLDVNIPCKLRLGYTNKSLSAIIYKIGWKPDGKSSDLNTDKSIFEFYLKDIKG